MIDADIDDLRKRTSGRPIPRGRQKGKPKAMIFVELLEEYLNARQRLDFESNKLPPSKRAINDAVEELNRCSVNLNAFVASSITAK